MKKTFANIRTLAAVLMASAALVACNKEHNATAEQTPQVYTLTIQAGMNDGTQTKALELEGTKLVAKWEEGETVEVRKGATLLGNLTVSNVSADGQSCTLSGTLTGDIRREDTMRLYYHRTGLVNESQTGTLASAAESDYAVARVEVDSVDGDNISLKSNPSFETQVAMLKLTMKDGSANLLNATSLQITIGDIAPYTFSPTAATYTANGDGVVYFALPSASRLSADSGTSLDVAGLAAASVTFTATVGADTYTVTKTGYAFAAGKYYATTLTMAKIISLSGRYSSDDELVIADGCILTGYGYNYSCKVSIADGATVTLRDVENNGDIAGCPGIKCLGDATIILEGDNTVTGGDQYAGIYVPGDKTLTIRGTGSLNVTGGSRAAGIGGNATGDANCGSIVISGGTVTATGSFGGAGIGLGANGGECKAITISGGTVEATGGSGGAGIGLGANGEGCKAITISGGTVTAKGDDQAPGIGGATGYYESITITGDVTKVTATRGSGAQYSIGIEDVDSWDYCGPITIGGTVYFEEGNFTNDDLKTSQFVYQP
ncbi:MAG: hypothetical protein IJ616_01595 [Bacteroidales bacterium]|nr:hypothetical protein [Bacteroidales bacterium]